MHASVSHAYFKPVANIDVENYYGNHTLFVYLRQKKCKNTSYELTDKSKSSETIQQKGYLFACLSVRNSSGSYCFFNAVNQTIVRCNTLLFKNVVKYALQERSEIYFRLLQSEISMLKIPLAFLRCMSISARGNLRTSMTD